MAVAASGGALLPAKIDHPQVELVPICLWEECLEVAFGFHDVSATGQAPSLCKAMDVRVHGKGRDAKGLAHDDARRLVPHPRQLLERPKSPGNRAAVLFNDDSR